MKSKSDSVFRRTIWITTQFVGFHSYPDAPSEVIFLKNKHRHVFHCKVEISVNHDDRDIEFFMFKNYIHSIIKSLINRDNTGSCEHIASIILSQCQIDYPNREIAITVSEDNENGATVTNHE